VNAVIGKSGTNEVTKRCWALGTGNFTSLASCLIYARVLPAHPYST